MMEKRKKPYPPRRPQRYNGLATMGWKELKQIHRRHSRGSSAVRKVKKSRRDRVEICAANTTRFFTLRKASGDPNRQRSLARRSRAFLFKASVSVKSIEAKGQNRDCQQDRRRLPNTTAALHLPFSKMEGRLVGGVDCGAKSALNKPSVPLVAEFAFC